MRHTAKQDTKKTLADLLRAMDKRVAVTVTYTDRHGVTEVRTIEIHEIHAKDGDHSLTVMCRLRGDERRLSLSRISSYTVHRIGYVLTRPEPEVYERPAPLVYPDTTDVEALQDAVVAYELARDPDDADYRPRVQLAA